MTDVKTDIKNGDYIHIACPHCFAKNRIPTDRVDQAPVCGKCKTELINTKPAELDDSTLSKYINGTDQIVVIDFWASWCQPCIMMAPQFVEAAKQMPNVRFAKIQTDKFEQSSSIYGIRSLPTIVAFKNSKELARQSGLMPAQQIAQWLTSLS